MQAAIAFAGAAPRYWGSVYPQVRREAAAQHQQARAIPDPRLRGIALRALDEKRANIDGAAAFAAFVPRARRRVVVRAQVAFQALYDYLDMLTEQPHPDPVGNSRMLHGALLAALRPAARGGAGAGPQAAPGEGDGYLAHEAVSEDGGYMQATVQRCQAALAELPGYEAVQPAAQRLGRHIVEFQSFNVTTDPQAQAELERWAGEKVPAGSGLGWWEVAASAGSSLGLFALMAMAAGPQPSAAEAEAVEHAYFPWVGALHSLLDSLIDQPEDERNGQPSLVAHYGGQPQAARGMVRLAEEARRRLAALPDAHRHALVLAAMASIYLAEPRASGPHASEAAAEVRRTLGGLARPVMGVMRLRQAALATRF